MSDFAIDPQSNLRTPFLRPAGRSADIAVDGLWTWVRSRVSRGGAQLRRSQAMTAARAAISLAERFQAADDDVLNRDRQAIANDLRFKGYRRASIIEGLALAREMCRRKIGFVPYLEQVAGGYALVRNAAIEMDTGEGKTLTAVFPCAIHGFAGRAVHVVTSNDYLANRDGTFLRPVLEGLGLSVGIVVHESTPTQRREAYGCDITFVSNKEVAFDYLRDRLTVESVIGDIEVHAKTRRMLSSESSAANRIMRGLDVAIVDEVDSVLVDDAGTPLLISSQAANRIDGATTREALDIAKALVVREDFVADHHGIAVELTDRGVTKVDHLTAELDGAWKQRVRRYEMVRAAITATHSLERDRHYLVREGKIVLIDEFSGRTMPDRYWGHDLHHMVEMKEGCASSGERKTLASISFQRFFRSYRDLAGMSGTIREVAVELSAVYGLSLTRIPRRRPLRRRFLGRNVYASRTDTWDAAARLVRTFHERGQPVLVGVRTVREAGLGSEALVRHGIEHTVLSAAHDQHEAEIIAKAGEPGAVTIATNMAGRGTDIKLGKGVADLGGLVVMICERHDARRIDRQLMGRCARQGDPGIVVELLSREDSILRHARAFRHLAGRTDWAHWFSGLPFREAQWRIEQENARRRIELVKRDDRMRRMLGFAGGLD
jgi:preprotein translocase subunit SecA